MLVGWTGRGFERSRLTTRNALQVATLPRHHRDPFDRLLVAQAQIEDLTILTADALFDAYDVATIAAPAVTLRYVWE